MPETQPVIAPSFRWPRRRATAGLLAALAVSGALAACGGDDEPAATTIAPAPSTTAPVMGSSPDAELTVRLTPERVGTEQRPQPVRIAVDLRMEPPPDDADVAPVQTVHLTIPDGVVFRSDELEPCDRRTLEAEGPESCPGASRIGSGTVSASAGAIEVEGEASALYGGDERVWLWVRISNPVSVGAAIEGRLEEQSEGGYRLALQVPAALQDVAGLPVALSHLRVSLGRGGALATTGCPDGKLPFFAELNLAGDLVVPAATTARCR